MKSHKSQGKLSGRPPCGGHVAGDPGNYIALNGRTGAAEGGTLYRTLERVGVG